MAERRPTLAKLARPRPFGVIPRERLFRSLDELRQHGIVWVEGPPGAGKTALISSYVENRKLGGVWYQVDAGDHDPASFFGYLALAAQRPARRKPLPLLSPEFLPDLQSFSRSFFREFFSGMPVPSYLALDNYQDAPEGSVLHEVIREACMQVPDGINVFVMSRSEPPVELASLSAKQRLAVIGRRDLLVSLDEARRMVSASVERNESIARMLHTQSAGWAAGLVLMREHLLRNGADVGVERADSQAAVFNYFAGEVLDRAAPDTQELLLTTSLLPQVTVTLARQVSGKPDAERILDRLYRRGYFTDRLDGVKSTYQYHALFREFLLDRAAAKFTAAELGDIADRAANHLIAEGHGDDAVALLLRVGAWSTAAQAILREAAALHAQGRWATLSRWIGALPPDLLNERPWLGYWVGVSQTWVDPASARRHLEQAYAVFARQRDGNGQVLAASLIVKILVFDQTNLHPLDDWISALERHLTAESGELSSHAQVFGLYRLLLAINYRQPQHPRRSDIATRLLRAIDASDDVNDKVLAGSILLVHCTAIADTKNGGIVIARTNPLLGDQRLNSVNLMLWKTLLAGYYTDLAVGSNVFDLLRDAQDIARGNAQTIWEHYVRDYFLRAHLALGDVRSAQTLISETASEPALRSADWHLILSWLSGLQGDFAAAESHAFTGLNVAREAGNRLRHHQALTLYAEVLAERGEYSKALACVDEFRTNAAGIDGRYFVYRTLLVEAYVALRRADHDGCVSSLRAALLLGRGEDFVNHRFWLSRPMVRLYGVALDHGIQIEYTKRMIRLHRLVPESVERENWPWEVKIYTLGRFSILVDDVPLETQGRVQRKTLELLQALVALGGRDVDAATLAQALWPEAEGDAGHHALETCVHRLRKLIGHDAVVMHSSRMGLDAKRCWVDVWALERSLARLTALLGEGADGARIQQHLTQMQSLYKGPFLGQDSQPWLLATRERLRGRYLRGLDAAADRLEQANQLHQALELLYQGIDLDPFTEGFYRRLMTTCQRLGRPAEALAIWRRCQRTLSVGLGISPSSETEAIARELQH